MSVDFESLSDVLKHPIRRRILLVLYEKGSMLYVDLMHLVGVTNTGKFNYHLKILGDLIEKDQKGKYGLTEKGQMAAQLLHKFPGRKVQQAPLPIADATLIGFAGVVLTVVNPVFWGLFFIASLELEFTSPFFIAFHLLIFAYALIVPGAVMWLLTIRRSKSHDMYDLLKPPFAAFILLLVLLVTMVLLGINLTAQISSPMVYDPHSGGYTYSVMQTSLQRVLFLGLILSFFGVIIAEFASRIKQRVT